MTNFRNSFFPPLLHSNPNIFVVVSIVFTLLLIENVDAYVVDFLVEFNTSVMGIILFTIIAGGYLVGQFFLLKFIRSNSRAIKSRSRLIANLQNVVTIVQYILAANIIVLIIQVIVLANYSTMFLIYVTTVSNFFTAFLLTVFAFRFITWYRNQTHSVGVLLFALAFLILAFSEVIAGLGDSYLLSQKEAVIYPTSEVKFYDFPEGSFFNTFYDYYHIVNYASFFLTLIGSALLLYHYSKKTNKPKIILIMFLPLFAYTSSILDTLNIYNTDTSPDLFAYYIFQSLISITGGILFAISFWFVARKLSDSPVKTFLKITAYGFILLYVSNSVDVSIAPYPPFGINSLSLLPLATYFVLFGLYSSALSLSQDITLRNYLRKIARSDKNLLSSIGTAQMETEVIRAVGELKDVFKEQEKELAVQSGIETPISENEVEDYLKQVIEEVTKARKK
jgi:hypothetical protein